MPINAISNRVFNRGISITPYKKCGIKYLLQSEILVRRGQQSHIYQNIMSTPQNPRSHNAALHGILLSFTFQIKLLTFNGTQFDHSVGFKSTGGQPKQSRLFFSDPTGYRLCCSQEGVDPET